MPTKGKTVKGTTAISEPAPEVYNVNYTVNLNGCTITNLVINQTGKPPDPPADPPGGNG